MNSIQKLFKIVNEMDFKNDTIVVQNLIKKLLYSLDMYADLENTEKIQYLCKTAIYKLNESDDKRNALFTLIERILVKHIKLRMKHKELFVSYEEIFTDDLYNPFASVFYYYFIQ